MALTLNLKFESREACAGLGLTASARGLLFFAGFFTGDMGARSYSNDGGHGRGVQQLQK